jgi:dephospho-CoA kinase
VTEPGKDLYGRAKVIGLLGGMGSGKSEVARVFAEEARARVISGDALAHEALRRPEVREQIARRWGPGVLDERGEVDRKQLGGIVFATRSELEALEALVHPWIKARILEELDAARRDGARLVVLDAAIMLEAGWSEVCDELVFVEVPREVRLGRVARQRGWTEKEVEAREMAQMPLAEKAARADHILENSGTLEDLRRQVRALLARRGVSPTTSGPESR